MTSISEILGRLVVGANRIQLSGVKRATMLSIAGIAVPPGVWQEVNYRDRTQQLLAIYPDVPFVEHFWRYLQLRE